MLCRSANEFIADDDTNTVVVQLVEYGTARPVSDGGPVYREAFDSIRPATRVHVKDHHGGSIIGHADPATFRESPHPSIDMTIADTSAGRDMLALVRAGSISDVSVEFNPKTGSVRTVEGVTYRANTEVHAIAFAPRPAHIAPVLAVREETEITMPDTAPLEIPADVVRTADLTAELDAMRREISVSVAPAAEPKPYADLAKFRSLGEYTQAAFNSPELGEQFTRALTDQITTDNPGVILPGYISDVKRIVDANRPTINAFGSASLPGTGMSVEFPFTDTDIKTLIGAQATEKTAITSVVVSIEQGTEPVATYAGGSDISVQLIQRSSPAYLTTYMRLMASGMAATTDAAMGAKALASATAGTVWVPGTGTLDEFTVALVSASIAIEAATGAPAAFVLAASDTFEELATLSGLFPPQYSTQNVQGESSARTLQVSISGVPIIHDQYLAAGTILVSNDVPAEWMNSGTQTISAPNVELLGQDVAIFELGATMVYAPAGIISIAAA
jgi:hypothetical protein